jgi:uncharacterized protein
MNYFFYKLIPPRPSFSEDMTEAEGKIMQEHFAYWRGLMKEGKVVVVGPVLDPKGIYGIAVLEAEDEALAQSVAENDPAITSKASFSFEVHPMMDAEVRQQYDAS